MNVDHHRCHVSSDFIEKPATSPARMSVHSMSQIPDKRGIKEVSMRKDKNKICFLSLVAHLVGSIVPLLSDGGWCRQEVGNCSMTVDKNTSI